MNAILSISNPLPNVLDQISPTGPCRRHRIDTFDLSAPSVDRFNDLLFQLGRQKPALDGDRLATAARDLCGRSAEPSASVGIARELRRGVLTERMITDSSWAPASDAAGVARQVIEYLRAHDDLIPDALPKVGRLDDAIVIQTAWPSLVYEIASYVDFRRIRRIEAALRGMAERAFGFTRSDWQEARMAERELAALQRSVRSSSYLPSTPRRFLVH